MPSKNSLSSLKQKPQGKLKNSVQNAREAKVPEKVRGTPGARPKPADKKESFTLTVKLTEAEGAILKGKAGLTPLGTWMKSFLRNDTDVLNKEI